MVTAKMDLSATSLQVGKVDLLGLVCLRLHDLDVLHNSNAVGSLLESFVHVPSKGHVQWVNHVMVSIPVKKVSHAYPLLLEVFASKIVHKHSVAH